MGVDIFPYADDFQEKIEETKDLVLAAEGQVVESIIQKRKSFDKATVIGEGKIDEVKALIELHEADAVLFNMELTGTQLRNLEEALGIKVIDRTMLILDIFSRRAITQEGKLQVQLAQNQYRLPRLAHKSPYLSRLAGGIGTRGPGESQLESDRRHIQREIKAIKKKLEVLSKHRRMSRSKRRRSSLPIVCLLGYTNAGKSSILNAMIEFSSKDLKVDVMDMPFASLQPFTRKIDNPTQTFLMSDTVGFVSDLPTHLVEAFQSTLEEIRYADILIHVVDASSHQIESQLETVNQILSQIDTKDKTLITYFNKMDKVTVNPFDYIVDSDIILKGSAKNKEDMLKLFQILLELMEKKDE